MCFSLEVSFISSSALFLIGILTLRKIRSKSQTPFALIPIFFSLQQAAEGFIWLNLTHKLHPILIKFITYFYLFFALLLWPIWIPFSLLCLEKEKTKKKLLLITFFVGLFVCIFNVVHLIIYGAYPEIIQKHIYYELNFNEIMKYAGMLLYCVATILPFFISSIKYMWLFGSLVSIALLISYISYYEFLTSVWCFFAAILSIFVYWILYTTK